MLELKTGNYYLNNAGYIYKIMEYYPDADKVVVSKLDSWKCDTYAGNIIRTILIKDLGNNRNVVRLLYSSIMRGKHVHIG